MHVMDIIVVIGVAATITQTGYIAVTYHNTAYQTVAPRPRVARRHFLLMSSLALISWAAVAFDYYDRHHSNPGDVLMGWGCGRI